MFVINKGGLITAFVVFYYICSMKNTLSTSIISRKLAKGAIFNDEYQGFHEDYLVLHCLLRLHNPKTLFEIGTNMGTGTMIMKNAVPDCDIYSLDLPTELADLSLQHPINEGKGDSVGHRCSLPFTQLRGDSMKFDYSQYKCDAYFIDGEHDYDHPHHETKEVLKLQPKLIVWHDSDMTDVRKAIDDAFKGVSNYDLFRVTDTRIAYAIKK